MKKTLVFSFSKDNLKQFNDLCSLSPDFKDAAGYMNYIINYLTDEARLKKLQNNNQTQGLLLTNPASGNTQKQLEIQTRCPLKLSKFTSLTINANLKQIEYANTEKTLEESGFWTIPRIGEYAFGKMLTDSTKTIAVPLAATDISALILNAVTLELDDKEKKEKESENHDFLA